MRSQYSNSFHRLFHRQRGRVIVPGQKIHSSVLQNATYNPSASFRKKMWAECREERTAYQPENIWEEDIFEQLQAIHLLDALDADTHADWHDLLRKPDLLERLAIAVISGRLKVLPMYPNCEDKAHGRGARPSSSSTNRKYSREHAGECDQGACSYARKRQC